MVKANFSKIVYEDFVLEFKKFFTRVEELKNKMLQDVADNKSTIDDYEHILQQMFISAGEIFDYMVVVIRFFISGFIK